MIKVIQEQEGEPNKRHEVIQYTIGIPYVMVLTQPAISITR